MAYRIYITDCLKGLAGATSRYIDLVSENNSNNTDEDPEDIKKRLMRKLGEKHESI